MEAKDTVNPFGSEFLTNNDWDEGGGFTEESVKRALSKQSEIYFKAGYEQAKSEDLSVTNDLVADARKAGMQELVGGFQCEECSTPGFVHLVIPVNFLKGKGLK